MNRALVYSQDPGGANVVARVAARLETTPSLPPRITAVHPLSEAVFKRLGVTATPVSRWLDTLPASDRAIDAWLDDLQPSHLICSLSSTRLDLTNGRLIARARAHGVTTLGYLDHWVGFERLMTSDGELRYAPHLIGCIDAQSREALIRLGLSAGAIREVGQPHLEAVACESGRATAPVHQPVRILLVSQPAVTDGSYVSVFHLGCDGRSVLEQMTDALEPLVKTGTVTVAYRAHPKERPGPELPRYLAANPNLRGSEALTSYDVFVGVTSMLLFEAAVARRAVVQLDIPVLRRSVGGAWPPYRAGIQVTELPKLRAVVADAVAQLRRGARPAELEGLHLTGSLDRATVLAVEFLQGMVRTAALETR